MLIFYFLCFFNFLNFGTASSFAPQGGPSILLRWPSKLDKIELAGCAKNREHGDAGEEEEAAPDFDGPYYVSF